LLPLRLLTLRKLTSNQVHIIFTLTILADGMLYFASMQILNQGGAESLLAGYSFMPFMFVSIWELSLLPCLGRLIDLNDHDYLSGLKASLGQLITVDTANILWYCLFWAAYPCGFNQASC